MQEQEMKKLFDLISDVKVCMMTTRDPEGYLRSRPMMTQTEYQGSDLWFFTHKKSAKIEEIAENGEVNLSYAEPSKQHYVSISGHASYVTDKIKMKELWNPAYRAWFPEGLDDPNISLMRVSIEKAEYWDSPSSLMVHLIGFTKAMLSGQRYHPGENQKINANLH